MTPSSTGTATGTSMGPTTGQQAWDTTKNVASATYNKVLQQQMWELPPHTMFVISSSHICDLCLCADCGDCSGGEGVRGLQGEALHGAQHWQRLAFASSMNCK